MASEPDIQFEAFADFSRMSGLEAHIQSVLRRIETDLLDDVATLVRDQTRKRIKDTKRSPDGELWPKRKEEGDGHGLLYKTGALHNSIEALRQGTGHAVVVSFSALAPALHFGPPARPFLGVGKQDSTEIQDLIDKWVRSNA